MSSRAWYALWKKSTKFATSLTLACVLATDAYAADSTWNEARSLFEAGKYSEARSQFERWGTTDPARLESSAYWHNLAACDWKLENDARTAHGLLSSLRVGGWPTDAWKTLDTLKQVESKFGIKQGVTQKPVMMALLVAGKRVQIWLLLLGLWTALLSVATLGLPSRLRRQLRAARYGGVSFGLLLAICGGATYAAHRYYLQFGVVSPTVESAEVFRDANLKNNEAGLRLPSGAVVAIRSSTEKAAHILEPIEGWIAQTDLAIAAVPLSAQETRVSVRFR